MVMAADTAAIAADTADTAAIAADMATVAMVGGIADTATVATVAMVGIADMAMVDTGDMVDIIRAMDMGAMDMAATIVLDMDMGMAIGAKKARACARGEKDFRIRTLSPGGVISIDNL